MKAFISYKWEDEEHTSWVKRLATDLRLYNIDAILDQWEVRLGDSLSTYMATKISNADAILFIISPGFIQAAEASQGKGGAVQFEVQMASARRIAGDDTRLIGIYRCGDKLPAQIRDNRYLDFRDDLKYAKNLTILVNDLLGKSDKPPLGRTGDPNIELAGRIQKLWETGVKYMEERDLNGATEEAKKIMESYKTQTEELGTFLGTLAFRFSKDIYKVADTLLNGFLDWELRLPLVRSLDMQLCYEQFRKEIGRGIKQLHELLQSEAD
jgi:hypothetical protein